MVQLDHRILLGGQDFDAVGQLQRAASAAKTANANRDANALRAWNPVQELMTGSGNALRGGGGSGGGSRGGGSSGGGGGGLMGSMQQQQEEQMRQLALTGVEMIRAGRVDEANSMLQQYMPGAPAITGLDDPNLHAILAQVPGFAEAYQQRIEMGSMLRGPQPSYELMDINGDGVMEYVDPSNPNAPIKQAPGMQAGPQEPGYDVPEGYMLRDPNNPRAGVMPVPGISNEPDLTEAEQELARLEAIGIPRDISIKIKEGVYRVITDPVTREAIVIDLSNGQPVFRVEQDQGQPAPGQPTSPQQDLSTPPPQAEPRTRLDFGIPYEGASDAFGMEGALRGAINTGADALGLGPAFPETLQAQRDFAVLREQLIGDIAAGYDRQPPSWLLKNIEDLVPTAGRPFQGPDDAQARLRAIGRSIRSQAESAQTSLDRQRLSPTERQALQNRVTQLRIAEGRISDALSAFSPGVNFSDEERALLDKYRD